MSMMIEIMLLGAIPIVLVMFAVWPARRAAVAGFLFCTMFLPVKRGWVLEGLPDYDKVTAGSLAVLLGILIFDGGRLLKFKPRWFDWAMLMLLVGPIITAVSNKIGGGFGSSVYGGATITLDWLIAWGVPYFVGRIYFTKLEHLKELAIILFTAGLIYAPLCLYEIRFSPQLNAYVYGYYQSQFVMTMRLSGFRPMVFMNHGLMVGLFMTVCALLGLYLWRCGSVKKLYGMPMGWLVGGMLVTAVLCKSTGAIGLLLMGLGVFAAMQYGRLKVAMLALLLVAPLYMATRASGVWTGRSLVEWITPIVGEDRAGSLEGRMGNEDLFVTKARERIIWGWSAWDRFQVTDDRGVKMTTPDGLWVIVLGTAGLAGLSAVTFLLLYPGFLAWWRFPREVLLHPDVAPVTGLVMVLTIWMIDNIPNAMPHPAFIVAAGALPTAMPRLAKRAPARKPAAAGAPLHRPPRAPQRSVQKSVGLPQ